MSDRQRHGFILLLVLGLVAASLFVIFTQTTELGLDLKGGTKLVYQGEPSGQTPHVTQAALDRAVDIMRERVDQLGVSEPEIQTTGGQSDHGRPARRPGHPRAPRARSAPPPGCTSMTGKPMR